MVTLPEISDLIHSQIEFGSDDLTPVEWIEKNRHIQQHVSERMFGQFDFSNTPYMREITDFLSHYNPTTHLALMKGVRIGGTFSLVHNGVPYIIDQRPTNIMLISANKDLATKTMQGVDNGIDGCNIRHLLSKGSGVQSNSKGDTMEKKFFCGGFELFNFGGQAASNMRQVTAGFIAADEVDAIKGVSKDSGAFLKLMEDRARSYGDAKKIVYISSPLLLESSLIYELYLRGDQRIFYVPCPCCGEYIELVWNKKNEKGTRYGVIFDVSEGEVVKESVRYRCGECENEWKEKKHKRDILNAGYWRPQVNKLDKSFRSYHISALYAPVTMDNWYDFAKEYQLAFPRGGVKIESLFQSFRNSIEGLPFKPEGQTIKSTKLQGNRRDYKIGECPFELSKKDGNGDIMFITLASDLNGYEHDGRIDYEAIAWSEKGASYSIDAGSIGTFIPKVEKNALEKEGINVPKLEHERIKYSYHLSHEKSIWNDFRKIMHTKYGKHNRPISITVVDTGHFEDYATGFVSQMKNEGVLCVGLKGADEKIFTAQIKTDTGLFYKKAETSDSYLLNVNIIKDLLSKYIESESEIDDKGNIIQPVNFMNFPQNDEGQKKYTYRNYFAHYEAEHKIVKKTEGGADRYIWEKKRPTIQNHFWDVRVYGLFCRKFLIDLICSNDNPFKKHYYKTQKIHATWENTCRLIKEASIVNKNPLS